MMGERDEAIVMLGKTLLIANPMAQSGNGATAALYAGDRLREVLSPSDLDLIMTESASHGRDLALQAESYETVVALGGDGLIHQVANGLMAIPQKSRPVLGVLPVGTGNDYARTLGIDFSIKRSMDQLFSARPKALDIGCCNGEYFVETLSFGLDAAIAHDTMKKRALAGSAGSKVFFDSGIDILLHQMRSYDFDATIEGSERIRGAMIMFAVQVGPTYGGGFAVCPDAKPDDGLFDLCITHAPLGVPKALMIFLLAKKGRHTKFKQLEFMKAAALTVEFDRIEPPAQVDGEPFNADSFDIRCIPAALQVLVPTA